MSGTPGGLPPLVKHIVCHQYSAIDERLPRFVEVISDTGADQFWHKHGNFREHLLNTYFMLKLWNQSKEICDLALFHSSYSNSFVKMALFKPDEDRPVLRELIGQEAEELVHLFCVIPRYKAIIEDTLLKGSVPAEGLTVAHIRTGEPIHLSQKLVGEFCVVTMADNAEQNFGWQDLLFEHDKGKHWQGGNSPNALWPGDNKPGLWMNHVSRLGVIAKDCGVDAVPQVFEGCTVTISEEDEKKARDMYWDVVCNKSQDFDAAEPLLLEVLKANPFIAEPHLLLGQIYASRGQFPLVLKHAQRGLDLLVQWGTPWDKRLPWSAWIAWGRTLLHQATIGEWPDTAMGILSLGTVPSL